MPVTTFYHPRSPPPYPNEIDEIEEPWPQDRLSRGIEEGDDRGDLMGGSQGIWYSSDGGEGHGYSVVACIQV